VQISISTRHGHVGDETQAKIQEKLEKLPRLYDRISAIELTVDMEHRDAPSVDLKISAKQHDFVAAASAANVIAALDVAVEKMEQQLRKHKQKLQDRHRSSGHRPGSPLPPEPGK
jgi:putative sigma-54 modulation protein